MQIRRKVRGLATRPRLPRLRKMKSLLRILPPVTCIIYCLSIFMNGECVGVWVCVWVCEWVYRCVCVCVRACVGVFVGVWVCA